MTAGPLAGPASAYPTLRRPASICFSGAKDVFVPGLMAGTSAAVVSPGRANADPIMANSAAATLMAELRIKRRRSLLIGSLLTFSDILASLIGLKSVFCRVAQPYDRWRERTAHGISGIVPVLARRRKDGYLQSIWSQRTLIGGVAQLCGFCKCGNR